MINGMLRSYVYIGRGRRSVESLNGTVTLAATWLKNTHCYHHANYKETYMCVFSVCRDVWWLMCVFLLASSVSWYPSIPIFECILSRLSVKEGMRVRTSILARVFFLFAGLSVFEYFFVYVRASRQLICMGWWFRRS